MEYLQCKLEYYQENNKKLQIENNKEKFFKSLAEKNNSHLKNRNKELNTQIKELKAEIQFTQKLQLENQDLKKKFDNETL
jgi:hypothetical protein